MGVYGIELGTGKVMSKIFEVFVLEKPERAKRPQCTASGNLGPRYFKESATRFISSYLCESLYNLITVIVSLGADRSDQ